MKGSTVGIDLAKNVFQVHAIDDDGEVIVRRALRRRRVIPFFSKLEPCLIGMEACGTSHFWARELCPLGHEVKLMPPAYVKPYVKRGKTDAGDAAAICEAVTRPTMRFVAIESPERQAMLAPRRARALLVRQRTQLVNMIPRPTGRVRHRAGHGHSACAQACRAASRRPRRWAFPSWRPRSSSPWPSRCAPDRPGSRIWRRTW